MKNFNIKSQFLLESFQFDPKFTIPPVKKMDVDSVINIYENMRDFFPKYQENNQDIILAPRLENILDNFDALLLDAYGVLNVGSSLTPGIIETLEKARQKNIILLVVTNGASNNSFRKRDQLASLGLEFSYDEIISSRETAEIFLSFNQPEGPLGVLGNVGDNFSVTNLNCFELERDHDMFDQMNSFILLGTLQWDTVWQEILFNSLKSNPRPLFVANPDLVAPHEKNFSMEPAYYVSHLIKSGIHLPFWIGKPFPTIFELAINRLNELSGREIPLSRVGMVGDTLHTDILGANSFGLKSILMTKHGLFKNTKIGNIIRKTNISPNYIVEAP